MTIIEHEILSVRPLAVLLQAPAMDRAWRLEAAAAPSPLHPLEYDLTSRPRARAFNAAAAAVGLPLEAASLRLGGYAYVSYASADVADREQRARHASLQLLAAAERLGARWEREQLPEIEEHLRFWRGFHPRGATLTAMIAHFDETLRRLDRVWRIVYDVGLPLALAPRALAELHVALFGEHAEAEVALLLQGGDMQPRATDHELAQLAATASDTPSVREALRWCADHEVVEALLGREEGRAFLMSLRAPLCEESAGGEAGRIGDPLPLIRRLKQYVRETAERNAAQDRPEAVARVRLASEIAARLALLPGHLAQQYAVALASAQDAARVRQERAALVERVLVEARRVMLDLGRRFAEAGVIALAGDVFYLEAHEVRLAAETMPWVDMRPRILRRRAEMERARTTSPARSLGAAPEPDDVERRLLELAYDAA